MPARLGQLLITSNIITEDQLKEALGLQRKEGGRLWTNLVKLGHITEEKLVAFLSTEYNVEVVVSSESSILNAISTHYADHGESLVAAKGMVSAKVLQAGSYTTHEAGSYTTHEA